MGLLGACIDKKYGGSGYDLLTFSLMIEEISRCCASSGIIVSIHNCLYADLVQTYGNGQQIEKFLLPFTNGNLGAFAISEHGITWNNHFNLFVIVIKIHFIIISL